MNKLLLLTLAIVMSSVFAGEHRRMKSKGCHCLTNGLATDENECEGLGNNVEQCESKPQCHWGPEQNKRCMAERNNFQEKQQECHCLTTDSETNELECEGQLFTAKTCESKEQCHWGPTQNKKCLNERNPVDKRRMMGAPSVDQMLGCLGFGACSAALASSCVVAGTFTAEAGCVAAGGVLSVIGCGGAIKDCVNSTRRLNEPKPVVKRRMVTVAQNQRRMVTVSQVTSCLGLGACATVLGSMCAEGPLTAGMSCLVADDLLALAGCGDAITSCIRGNVRRLVEPKPVVKRRMDINFGQLTGCGISAGCAAALGTSCYALGVVTLGEGCLAAGGLLSGLGCVDAVKSCVHTLRRRLSISDM